MVELPDKKTQFIDWYLAVVEEAKLSDKRYGVKGMNVWTPYGFRARRNLDRVMIREIEATGSEAVEFPTLIPETEFAKEKEHIQGFDAQVYWVTKGGSSPLDVNLVLRPTSETAMYPVFALWVRSHQDLPLNVYQIVNTFRYETKTTRPFLRVREIHFFEEHTCQVDEAAATGRVESNLAAFGRMAAVFALPFLAVRRPEWDKFAGAYYSIALDISGREKPDPPNRKRTPLSRELLGPVRDPVRDPDGDSRLVHQTTFGLSERLLGAILAVHGDAKGAVFPRAIAPYEVVVIPILSASAGDLPLRTATEVADRLARHGLRVRLDAGPERPGAKSYRWELRGAPLRIEVGAREAAANTVTAVNRMGVKSSLSLDHLEEQVEGALDAFDRALTERAQVEFQGAFRLASSLEELRDSKTVRQVGWCGSEACGRRIEAAIDGALLGVPEGAPPVAAPLPARCIACGSLEGIRWALVGRPL